MNIRAALRRCIMLLSTVLCVLTATGCWDNAEINGRAFVLGVGIDSAEENGCYAFTFQLAVPVSGSSDSGDAIQYVNCTFVDRSAASAVRSLEKNMGRQINFEQLTVIIIGEDLSHGKFTQVTEVFFRRASVRRQSCVAVCSGSAEDFLTITSTGKAISSDTAIALQSYDTRSGAGSMVMNLHSLYTAVSNNDGFYLMEISAVDPSTQQIPNDSSASENKTLIPKISGAAVYDRDGKYTGKISGSELEFLRLVSNSQTSGIIAAADLGDDGGDKIYYQVNQSYCSRDCKLVDDEPVFAIKLSLSCSLVDGYGLETGNADSDEFVDYAERCITNELAERLEALADKSRSDLGAAALRLNSILRRSEPDWYDEHSGDLEEIYKASEIEIDISCKIEGGGLTQ